MESGASTCLEKDEELCMWRRGQISDRQMGLFFPYIYWDAYYRGYLLPNPGAMPVIEAMRRQAHEYRLVGRAESAGDIDSPAAGLPTFGMLLDTSRVYDRGISGLSTCWPLHHATEANSLTRNGPYPETQRYSSPPFPRR